MNLSARAENIAFHHILAKATHNPAIALTMDTLYSLEKEMLHEITTFAPGAAVPSRYSFQYHQKILKAMREKKPRKVYDLTFEHILIVLNAVKKLEKIGTTDDREAITGKSPSKGARQTERIKNL